MLLTIGMIVKNEEKHLRDCLTGLQPILDQVHSELIIYDTGSTDSSMEIAKEFTNNVFQIEWRKDFAWARQHTLDRARGKWFMFIDADEIFQDTTDLISFFNTGEYENFGCASILIKNLMGNGVFRNFTPTRLHKIGKGTRFVGSIHEHIEPYKYPVKRLESYVIHHGYNHADEASFQAKFERNITNLLEEFEKDPTNAKVIAQTIQEYNASRNYTEAKKFGEIGLKLFDKSSRDLMYHVSFYLLSDALSGMELHEKLAADIKDYFDNTTILYAHVHHLKLKEVKALNALKRYKEAGDAAVIALEYFDKNEKKELDELINGALTLLELERNTFLHDIKSNYACAGEFDLALKWEAEQQLNPEELDVFGIFAAMSVIDSNPEKLTELNEYARERFGINSAEYANAIFIIERYARSTEITTAVADAFTKGKLITGSSDDYVHLWNLRKMDYSGEQIDDTVLDYFLNADRPFSVYYTDVLFIAMRSYKNVSKFLMHLDTTNLHDFVSKINQTELDVIKYTLLDYLEKSPYMDSEISIKGLRVLAQLTSALAGDNIALFEASVRLFHRYSSIVYKEDIYCERNVASLPEQDAFAFFVGNAYECKDKGDKAGFAKNLRMSLRIAPKMKDIIVQLGEKLEREMSAPTVHDQLSKETGKIKSIIYTMINTGNKAMAVQMLDGYEKVYPADPEIVKIREMVEVK